MKNRFSPLLALSLLAAVGCGPSFKALESDQTPIQGGPQVSDVDLGLDDSGTGAYKLDWSGETTSAQFFRLTESLLSLSGGLAPEAQASWSRALLKTMPHERRKLGDSSYVDLVVTGSQDLARTKLDEVLNGMRQAPERIRALALGMKAPIGPNERPSLEQALHKIFGFLTAFDRALADLEIIEQVKSGVREELAKSLASQGSARALIQSIESGSTIFEVVTYATNLAKELGVELSAEASAELAKGTKLGRTVEAITNSESALKALVEVWIVFSPEERLAVFKPMSPELYDYLYGKRHSELLCLQDTSCVDIAQWLAKSLLIKPKLETYGISRIRSEINSQGATRVKEQVLAMLLEQGQNLPLVLSDKIEREIAAKQVSVEKLMTDYRTEFPARLRRWIGGTLEKEGSSVYVAKPARARLQFVSTGAVSVQWMTSNDPEPEGDDAFVALLPKLWALQGLEGGEKRALLLSQVARLASAHASPRGRDEGLRTPITARGFSEAIRGTANVTSALRRARASAFDAHLGQYRASELFTDLGATDLDQHLFPKDAFYGLGFKKMADELVRITELQTPVFLLDVSKRVTWANQSSSPDAAPVVMAGIVDRSGSTVSSTVKSENVARFLLAVSEVVLATDGVEHSTSSYLLTPDAEGKIPKDQILASRARLRPLIAGLANYLAKGFRAGSGLINPELDVATQTPTAAQVTVLDQALAIRALLAASAALKNTIYIWEAVDLVSAMNRSLFSPSHGFYASGGEASLSPHVLIETLRALEEVKGHLSPRSRSQIEKLTLPWLSLVGKLRWEEK